MADSILRLKVSSEEYDNKLKRAVEGLQRYADGCRKAGGTLEHVDEGVVEFTRSLGKMETTATTARGKLAEMTKAFTEMSVRYKEMTDEEKKGEFGKALNTSLNELKGRIQESKVQLDDISKSLNGGGGLSGALDAVAGKFGLSIDQLTKFGSVMGLATTAVQVAKDAFFQSESGIDEWGRTVEGAKGAYSVFLDTLNNGNWSNFFQNLSAAIRGGRDLYDVFDRLGSIKSNNAAAIAITQKEIAELRLAKQQGENVDAKLKSATERLAALQKQSVSAGMAAGSQSAFQTIRNGVNSVGGAGVNDATIKYAVDRIMKGGQGEFDKYKRNYEILQQKGMVTRTQTINDSQGGTYERQYKVFDINALTKEQQKQYALAKAITEGETRIQKGISAYAQAVSEGTASAREEFKGNRYALQGSGGRGGGQGGNAASIGEKDDFQEIEELIGLINIQHQKLQDLQALKPFAQTEEEIVSLNQQIKETNDEYQRLLNLGNEPMEDPFTPVLSPLMQLDSILKELNEELNNAETPEVYQDILSDIKSINQEIDKFKGVNTAQKTSEGWKDAAQAISSVGSALQSIEDPSAKIVGIVGQAIANIALGFAQATATSGAVGGIFGWIAAIAGGIATMTSTIAAIHSATGYADGGIVKGNTYSSDQIYAGLNAQEVVLNRAQAGNLASQLQQIDNGGGGVDVARISGEQVYIILNRYLKRSGRGEIATIGTKAE